MRIMYLFFIFIPLVVYGEIYKCVRSDGSIIYKDTPCSAQETQTVYNYTQRHGSFHHTTIKELNKCRKRLTKQRLRMQRQLEDEQKRGLRLRGKCERVMQKIELLNQRYRCGYTAKQRQSLDRKLAEYNIKRQKYCK